VHKNHRRAFEGAADATLVGAELRNGLRVPIVGLGHVVPLATSSGATVVDHTGAEPTETYDGGWGIAGHANTNEELVALARAELSGSS